MSPHTFHNNKASGVSIVIPCFQSTASLIHLVEDIQSVMQNSQFFSSHEIILVADGLAALRNLQELFPQLPSSLRILPLAKNYGEQIALVAGISYATQDYIFTLDDDGQHPAIALELLIEEKFLSGSGLVYAQNSRLSQPFVKHLLSRSAKRLFEHLLAPGASKISSVRLFDRAPAANALQDLADSRVVLDGVLLQIFPSVSSVAVEFRPRMRGRSNYSFRKLVGHTLDLALSAARVPLRALFWVSGLLTASGLVFGLAVAVDAVFFSNLLPPWGLLAATTLVIVGVQLLSVSIVGELVSRLLAEIRGYPLYRLINDNANKD